MEESTISTMGLRPPSFMHCKGQTPEESNHSSAILTMQSYPSSRSSKQKKINNDETKDYISQLPNSIIHHILSCSYLPLEDVIKTNVLSKRWHSVWTGVSALYFCHKPFDNRSVYDFARFVNTTLRLYCTGPNYEVKKLLISFKYKYSCCSDVNNWICFALERSVEELFLHFDGGVELSNSNEYELPESILVNSSFKILDIINCRIPKHCGSVSWTSLKVLSIASTLLYDDVIEKILLGSPGLESLKLKHCSVFSKLTVRSSSLIEFVAENVKGDTGTVMDISALNVYSLSLLGFIGEMRFKFINDVSSLAEVNLSFKLKMKTDGYKIHCHLLKELLMQLHHVEKLTIGNPCLQVLSLMETQSLPFPSSKRKSLIINSEIKKWDLPGITSLLQSSPHLEKLTINMMPLENRDVYRDLYFDNSSCLWSIDGDKYWTSITTKRNFECLSRGLKIVEINFMFMPRHIGFVNGLGQISEVDPRRLRLNFLCPLLEFLLKNAKVLEKVVLYVQTDEFGQPGVWTKLEKEVWDWECDELNQFILSFIQEPLRMLWLNQGRPNRRRIDSSF